MTAAPPPPPRRTIPAATLVIFRHAPDGGAPQVLMVQRAREMRFAGGMAVFPGGRIDEADRVLAAAVAPHLASDDDPDQGAARIAAVRETLEETGLLLGLTRPVTAAEARAARTLLEAEGALAPVLDRFGWTLALDRLAPFARWCPDWDGAFDTRFFLADLGTGDVELTVDATENTRLFWTSAAGALAMADNGEIGVIFPTRRNLDRLAQFASFAEAAKHAAAHPVRTIAPFQEERDGELHLCIPEGLGYPVTAQPLATVRRG
ncbi:MAG: NUDIX hydrolase [Sphingomonadales bacterium]|nr:NUDIX hydrolase [Sphingomonadales bacterium]